MTDHPSPRFVERLQRAGWTPYPLLPDATGRFVEDLDLIAALLGSVLYEAQRVHGRWFVRRIGS